MQTAAHNPEVVGSSPASATISSVHNGFDRCGHSIFSQTGDILIYHRKSKNDNGTVSGSSGHSLIYIDDAINTEEQGMLHTSGYDYTYNEDGTMKSMGNDNYGVRYDLLNNILNNNVLSENDTTIGYRVAILRPINKFCDENSCEIPTGDDEFSQAVDASKIENSKARTELSRLRIDQYIDINKTYNNLDLEENKLINNIGKYNSVNINDVITYNLRIQNKANISYCESSGVSRFTKSACESAGY